MRLEKKLNKGAGFGTSKKFNQLKFANPLPGPGQYKIESNESLSRNTNKMERISSYRQLKPVMNKKRQQSTGTFSKYPRRTDIKSSILFDICSSINEFNPFKKSAASEFLHPLIIYNPC